MKKMYCDRCGEFKTHFYGMGTHGWICEGCGEETMNIKPKDLGNHWCSKCGSVQPFKPAERGAYVRCQTCKTLFLSLMEEPQAKVKTVTKND